jgi:hypothetical protein
MMNKFIIKVTTFSLIFLGIITILLFFSPNKKIEGNSLFSNIDKHHRLDSLSSPKIIFVGASNFAYGLNSQEIEEKTGLPVVNMGLHAGFGLRFTLNEVKHAIRPGDIVVFSPVYEFFTSHDMVFGEKVLVALLFDVDRKNFHYIDFTQFINLIPNMISYGVSKMFPKKLDVMHEYNDTYEKVYTRKSFNVYGDETMHLKLKCFPIANPDKNNKTKFKLYKGSFSYVENFKNYTLKKGAKFYIIPPSFRFSNAIVNEDLIFATAHELSVRNCSFSFSPSLSIYPDSMFFNTPYHLSKQGVELYTNFILKNIFNK